MASLTINGASMALQYKRTTDRPIDSTDVWVTLADATAYAKNLDDVPYVPYAGQIISVLENGATYKLEKDADTPETDGKKHFKLVIVGSVNDNDKLYFKRDEEEKVSYLWTFMKGLTVNGHLTADYIDIINNIASKGFAAGASGFGITKDDNGNYLLDIDSINVRKKFQINTLNVQNSHYTNGIQYNTCGGMICIQVTDTGSSYRCFFKRTDADGKTINNTFETGDQALCQTFENSTAKYYWRLVTGTGDDYIDLSKTDADTGSAAPEAGDEIVQLGHRTDTSRQGAQCLDAVTTGGPYIRIYKGINSYTLPAPDISLSPSGNTIKGNLISESTGKTLDDVLNDIEIIKTTTDKEYVIWFYEYEPEATKLPESEWTTDAMKVLHENDIFYNRTAGNAYRYTAQHNWVIITDQDTLRALEIASHAQDTADSKRRVYVSQPTAADICDIGDEWTNATYPTGSATYTKDGVTYTADKPLYKNDLLVCTKAKAAGAAFDIACWSAASTATTAAIENLGDRITIAVSNSEDGIQSAKDLANKGINDAAAAAASAQAAQNTATTNRGLIDSNTSAIQVNATSIAAVSQKISTNAEGKITNIDTSGLVLTADFNTLLSQKVTFGTDGTITNISKSGLVTTDSFAGLFVQQSDANGLAKKAYIDTFITDVTTTDGVTKGHLANVAIGGDNVTIDAECINFAGKTIINNHFVVGTDGALTLDSITAKDITLSGTISGANAVLDSVTAKDITLSGTISGANAVLDSITAKDIKFSGTMAGGDATINDITINGKIHCQSLVETIVDKRSVDGFDVDPTEGHTFLVSLQPSTLSETYITLPSASSYPGLKLSFDVGPVTTRSAIRARRLYSANSELIYSSNSVQDAGYKYYAMPSCRTELVSSFGKWVVLNYSANANFTNS